jgi:hypothetical protein
VPLTLTSDTLGGHSALTVLTPVIRGARTRCAPISRGLDREESPLRRLSRTHFGRWVIVPEFRAGPVAAQA